VGKRGFEEQIALTQKHLQHWDSDSDRQANDHLTTSLSRRLYVKPFFANARFNSTTHLTPTPSGPNGSGNDVVEATNDQEDASRPCDGKTDLNANS